LAESAHTDHYSIGRLQRAMGQFVSGRALQAAGQAALILVLVRALSPPEFGAYMLIIGLAEAMLALGSFGTLHVARRFLPQMIMILSAPRLLRFVLFLIASQLGALLLLTAIAWWLWPTITAALGFTPERAATTLIALMLFFLIPSVNFACELLDALLEQGRSRMVGSMLVYSRLGALAFLLIANVHIDLALILHIDVAIVAFALIIAWVLLAISLRALHVRGASGVVPWREILHFMRHMAPMDMLGVTSTPGAIRLVLASTLGVVESGLFAFLQSLQRVVGRYLPGTLLRGIIMPVLVARAHQPGGRAIVEIGASLLTKSNLLIVAAGTVAITCCGDELVRLLSGGRFYDAGGTLLLMYLALAITSQRSILEMVLQIIGRAAVLGHTALISPLALCAMWMLAGRGIDTAVLILIAASALSNGIATAVMVRDAGGFKVQWHGQASIVSTGIVAAGVGIALHAFAVPALFSAALSVALFLAMQLVFRPFTEAEMTVVGKALGPRLGVLLRRLARSDDVAVIP
jgi:O-antigen/teichoic acid export membrane protein